MSRPDRLAALALVAATAAVMAPAVIEGSPVGHDSRHHLVWVVEFTRSLAAGIPYPRWLPDVNQGLGNPTFVFYPPAVYYLAAPVYRLFGSAAGALDAVAGVATLASGAAAYLYLRPALTAGAALVGAVGLMVLPYRLLDYYERAAIAEHLAFAWPLLALLAIRSLARAGGWRAAGPAAAGVALAVAGLALTHLPSLVLWGPILALAVAGYDRRPAGLLRGALALTLGLALGALFLLPAYVERPLVQMEWLAWVARPEHHTLFAAGMPHESQMIAFNHHVSRVVSWTALLAGLAALAAHWPGAGRSWKGRLPVAPAAVAGMASFLLMTPWSRPLWTVLPVLPAIQFPWRLAVVLTPAAALLMAAAAARAAAREAPRQARAAGALALLAAAVVVAGGAREVLERAYLDPVWAARIAARVSDAQDAAEYRPRTAPATGFPRVPRAEVWPAGGRAVVRRWGPERRVVDVEGPTPGRLRIGTFMYAGWTATLDGAPLPLEVGYAGTMEADVPSGRHVVEVRFGTTPARRAGAVVSAGALLLVAGWGGLGWWDGRRSRRHPLGDRRAVREL